MHPTPITQKIKTEQIKDKTFDEERALYNIKDTEVINCTFAGEADGESVLKEGRNYKVKNCSFFIALSYVARTKIHPHKFING